MPVLAAVLFIAGLLLAVRVMFFGVQRKTGDHLYHRAWPLALAAMLMVAGGLMYRRASAGRTATPGSMMLVVLAGLVAGAGAWWLVKRSAAIPSTDPEDDPRYRFQGHVARIIESIERRGPGVIQGRVAFEFDGKRHELLARWSPESDAARQELTANDQDVVIEFVDGDVAYVEPWTMVEERL